MDRTDSTELPVVVNGERLGLQRLADGTAQVDPAQVVAVSPHRDRGTTQELQQTRDRCRGVRLLEHGPGARHVRSRHGGAGTRFRPAARYRGFDGNARRHQVQVGRDVGKVSHFVRVVRRAHADRGRDAGGSGDVTVISPIPRGGDGGDVDGAQVVDGRLAGRVVRVAARRAEIEVPLQAQVDRGDVELPGQLIHPFEALDLIADPGFQAKSGAAAIGGIDLDREEVRPSRHPEAGSRTVVACRDTGHVGAVAAVVQAVTARSPRSRSRGLLHPARADARRVVGHVGRVAGFRDHLVLGSGREKRVGLVDAGVEHGDHLAVPRPPARPRHAGADHRRAAGKRRLFADVLFQPEDLRQRGQPFERGGVHLQRQERNVGIPGVQRGPVLLQLLEDGTLDLVDGQALPLHRLEIAVASLRPEGPGQPDQHPHRPPFQGLFPQGAQNLRPDARGGQALLEAPFGG